MDKMVHVYLPDLVEEVQIPKEGITSRALYNDKDTRVVIFGFDAGQELSEHTASMPAMLQILQGEATITLGTESHESHAGTWAYMPAHLPHSIVARTPLVMLLTMQKSAKAVQTE